MRAGREAEPVGRGGVIARNIRWNVVGQVIPLGLALLALPVLARALGPERLGLLGLAWMILTYARELGFGRATTKLVAQIMARKDEARAAAVVWMTAAVQAMLGLVAAAALVLLAGPSLNLLEMSDELLTEARVSLFLIAAALPPALVMSAFRGGLEGLQRFGLVNAVMAPLGAASFLLPLGAALLGWGVPGAVALLLAARGAGLVAMALLAYHSLPALARPRRGEGDLRELIRFGGWASVSTVVGPLLLYLDRAVIAVRVGVAAVGYYLAPFEVSTRLLIVPVSVVAALFPAVSALAETGDVAETRRLAGRSLRYLVLGLAPPVVFAIAAADPVLRLWLGAEFAVQGARALQILAFGVFVTALAHVPFSVLQGIGRPDLTAKLHMAELPLHIVLAWTLVGRWGIAGAAAAWTLRSCLDAAALSLLARRFAPGAEIVPAGAGVGRSLALAATGAVLAMAVASVVPGDWPRVAAVGCLSAAMLWAAWSRLLGQEERRGLLNLLRPGG